MNLSRLIPSVFFVCSFTISCAQKISTRFFTVKDGLPQSQVLSIAEDRLGYLWIGTYGGGLARFDGKTFSVYALEDGLRDSYVHKVYIDSHNNVWAGTSKGLSKFDGRKFTNYEKLTDVFIQILEFNDTLFVVNRQNRVSKIVNDSVICINCKIDDVTKVEHLVSNSPDYCYFVGDANVLYRRDILGNHKIEITQLGKVHNIFPTGDSVLIIASSGAYYWNKNKLRLEDRSINTPLILAEGDLNVRWAFNNSGIEKITKGSSAITTETIRLDALVIAGIKDADGNTWFGTSGNGLMKCFANDFELLGNPIAVSMLKSDNKLWVATRFNGVNIYRDRHLEKTIEMKNLGIRLKALREDMDGNIWVAAASNLAKIDKRTYQIIKYSTADGLKIKSISNIETDPARKLWISYRGEGLQLWDGKKFIDFPFNDKLSSMDVLGVKYIPYGDRLMVCTSNGVDVIKDGTVIKLDIPEFNKTPVLCATPYNKKYAFFGSDGKGLCVVNLDNSTVRYYSKKHGLVSDLICFVDTDNDGYVWIGTNLGIEKIKFNDRLDIEEHYYFSDANGLNGLEANVNASFISGDEKYFGLTDGLYRYAAVNAEPSFDFDLHFTKVELLNSTTSLSSFAKTNFGFYQIPLDPQLPHNQNSIAFSFSKVSKKYPESTEYKYILDGYDKEWSRQDIHNDVSYRDLPPGTYTFKVMASYFSNKWTNPYLEYKFTIMPPFYMTSYFQIVLLLFAGLLVTIIIYYIMRKKASNALALEVLKANEIARIRKEIGRDFHDELGNQLARIVNYISLIKLNRGKNIEMLTMVEESAKYLIGGTRDFIWALDNENDSTSNLFVHLKDFGDRLFSEKNIEFRAFHNIKKDTKLPMGHTRQINLIIKESMTNCFKHANATCVDLDFKELLFELRISLKDNGVGIDSDRKYLRNGGLSNIKDRAERINSRFEIRSNGSGTEINLYIKI